ncbi:acyltransferase [Mycolicibacterium baixiangningiae]|uniref:acyltransferase n=1 Tax=Mycolicibacterium baixiangningiae TaxID=2761578 RepID=UPI001866FB3D|nr:acyltransferase [Mycolicibacterium baixiangningiae]
MRLVDHVIMQSGRNYAVDTEIPRSFLYAQYVARASQLLRGLLTLRRRVFRGPSVHIMCKRNLVAGHFSTLGAGSIVDASGVRGVHLGRGAKIGRRSIVTTTSQLSKRGVGLTIGDYSGIGDYAHIGCSGGVTIGRDVIVGPYVTFHSQEHITNSLDQTIRSQGTFESEVIVENDVWIGARVTLLAGSHVRSGSVIAAGSVVRGEFPPNCIIGGVPAKVLKERMRP